MLFGASGEHSAAAAIHVRFETNSCTALSEFLLSLSTPNGLIDLLIVNLRKLCFSSVLCCGVLWAHHNTAYCALLVPAVFSSQVSLSAAYHNPYRGE